MHHADSIDHTHVAVVMGRFEDAICRLTAHRAYRVAAVRSVAEFRDLIADACLVSGALAWTSSLGSYREPGHWTKSFIGPDAKARIERIRTSIREGLAAHGIDWDVLHGQVKDARDRRAAHMDYRHTEDSNAEESNFNVYHAVIAVTVVWNLLRSEVADGSKYPSTFDPLSTAEAVYRELSAQAELALNAAPKQT